MREQLEHMADAIEMVLSRNESPARVLGGIVTPRVIRFDLCPALGTRPDRMRRKCAGELAQALGAEVRVLGPSHGYGTLVIEVKRADAPPVILADMLARLPAMPFGTAMLGIADDGAPLLLRLPSPDVGHVLIVGEHGAELAHTITTSLTAMHKPRELQVTSAEPSSLIHVARERLERGATKPLVVCMADVNVLSSVIERSAVEVLTACGHSVGVHVVGCVRDAVQADGARFGVRLVEIEQGYFAAESGAGVTRFTAAQAGGSHGQGHPETGTVERLGAAC